MLDAAAATVLMRRRAANAGLEGSSTTEAVRSTVANILGLIPVCPPSNAAALNSGDSQYARYLIS